MPSSLPTVIKRKPPTFQIGFPEQAILQALLRYHYLNSEQVTRLLYKPGKGNLSAVRARLKGLADHGFCLSGYDLRGSVGGRAPYAWTLDSKGLRYLVSQGFEIQQRFHAGEARSISTTFLAHTFDVNDFFISLELLCKRYPAQVQIASVDDFLPERVLKRKPPSVTIHTGEGDQRKSVRRTVVVDGFVRLTLPSQGRLPIALELDRGTEAQGKWRQKIAGLVAWWLGPYQEQFGMRALTVAVVTTQGAKRAADLQRWAEAELTLLGKEREADIFWFAAAKPALENPAALFFSPRFTVAFSKEPQALIPGFEALAL